MAGHSKFKNIMHKKGRADAARSKLFSRLSKEITVAVKMGGGVTDPDMNPRLRLAIQNARGQSMPKDNIQRAMNKGAGGDGEDYKEMRYEGYGPGGIAVIVECLTDNLNRTASNVRAAFTKFGGALGETGSVSFMFDRKGEITYPFSAGSDDAVMEAAIEAGAEDVVTNDDGSVDVVSSPEEFEAVKAAIEAAGMQPDNAEVTFNASTSAELDRDTAEKLLRMVDALEDLDDVQDVYTNADISEEILDAIG